MFVALRPVAGDHAYWVPPVALNVVLPPVHIALFKPALAFGGGFTVSTMLLVPEQPLALVAVTVYVVVTVGLAVGLAILVALRPVAGAQV